MQKSRVLLAVFGAAAIGTGLALGAAPAPAAAQTSAQDIMLLRSNTLVRVSSATPGTVKATLPVTGLGLSDNLLGIDVRAANGLLYGIGSSGVIYTISPDTGVATAGPTASTVPSGTNFGVDFNPAADRLRVVSSSGQSLRINVADGATTVDTSVAYAASDAGTGTPPVVVGAAYTNNDNNPATATELFNIESARDVLVLQNPPNDGVLVTRGALGVDAALRSGFDIAPDGTAMAVLGDTLYSVNVTTGATTAVGAVAGGAVDGMAFLTAAAPAPTTTTVAAPGTSTTRVLARTGPSTTTGIGIGGTALLALGAAMIVFASTRRAQPIALRVRSRRR